MYEWAITQSTAPTVEPILNAEARLHARIEEDEDDTLVDNLIVAARQYSEHETGRQYITATWKLYLNNFQREIVLPRPPLGTVSSIKYLDTNGDQQTLADTVYQVSTEDEPARITLAYGQSWPACRVIKDSIVVEYTAGYGAAGRSVPAAARQAMLLYISHLYENREPVIIGVSASPIPMTISALHDAVPRVGFIW